MRRFAGETFVVKYGGHAMGDGRARRSLRPRHRAAEAGRHQPDRGARRRAADQAMLDRLKIKSEFVDGLRVTDAATVEIVEMVLAGSINKQIVAAINAAGGRAVGLSGKDGHLIEARKLTRTRRDPDSNIEQVLDLGFVGEPVRDPTGVLEVLRRHRHHPGDRADRRRRRRRDLQHQRRHRGGRDRRRAAGAQAPAADRRRRACSTRRAADPRTDGRARRAR